MGVETVAAAMVNSSESLKGGALTGLPVNVTVAMAWAAGGVVMCAALIYWLRIGFRNLEWRECANKSGFKVRTLCQSERVYTRWARDFNGADKVAVLLSLECPSGQTITGEALRAAVLKLEDRHPLLRTTLRDWSTFQFQQEPARGGNQCLVSSVVEWERQDDKSWKRAWDKIQFHSLQLGKGLFEFVLISEPDQRNCELLLTGQHVVCDGDSMSMLGHELLQTLVDPNKRWERRQATAPQTAILLEEVPRFVQDRLHAWIVYFLAWLPFVMSLTKGAKASEGADPSVGFKSTPTLREEVTLTEEQTRGLIVAAKARGITVNSCLMSAISQAAREQHDYLPKEKQVPMGISCTVNMRQRYRSCKIEATDLSMHANGAYSYDYFAGHSHVGSLWQKASQLGSVLQNNLSHKHLCTPLLAAGLIYPIIPTNLRLGLFGHGVHIGNTVVVVGNWGRTPFQRSYGDSPCHAITLLDMKGMINFSIFNCVYGGFTTTLGRLKVSTVASPRIFSQDQMKVMSSRVAELLILMSLQGAAAK